MILSKKVAVKNESFFTATFFRGAKNVQNEQTEPKEQKRSFCNYCLFFML